MASPSLHYNEPTLNSRVVVTHWMKSLSNQYRRILVKSSLVVSDAVKDAQRESTVLCLAALKLCITLLCLTGSCQLG